MMVEKCLCEVQPSTVATVARTKKAAREGCLYARWRNIGNRGYIRNGGRSEGDASGTVAM